MRASLPLLALLLLLLALPACAGADDPDGPSRQDCAQLRDHIVDLRLAAADQAGHLGAGERAQHRAALQAAAGTSYLDEGTTSRTPHEVTCLLAASSLDSLNACTASHATGEN